MLLNKLIPTCFHPGTDIEDQGIQVKFSPNPDEKILFFEIDDQTNDNSPFRRSLGFTGAICDGLLYYYKYNKAKSYVEAGTQRHQREINQTVVCLIELKGSDIDYAAEQIINTCRFIKKHYSNKKCQPEKFKAYICTNISALDNSIEAEERLISCFGKDNYDIDEYEDISDFVRPEN